MGWASLDLVLPAGYAGVDDGEALAGYVFADACCWGSASLDGACVEGWSGCVGAAGAVGAGAGAGAEAGVVAGLAGFFGAGAG